MSVYNACCSIELHFHTDFNFTAYFVTIADICELTE